ncbi:hypothetical protein [Bradyrhizobium manausense]|uniref:hypothetical protein n=1 Tax=Bradyrhizobium manausense TaxID=989370 RepID=UPI001BA44BA6|nr:hypothetical protein [Bradyrhizobium manausense]MBR0721181.1 hypothetical protein [Bradyrhizobium manausense]
MSEELSDYCQRYRISYDWMLTGCLKGLKQMMDEQRGRAAAASPASLQDEFARQAVNMWPASVNAGGPPP